MDEPECPGCRDALKRIAELEARVAELTQKLDEATRAGKRQAAPFRKGPPKPDPKKPGRKSGDAHGPHGHRPLPPGSATESYHAALPDACPHCAGTLVETGTACIATGITGTATATRHRIGAVVLTACARAGLIVRPFEYDLQR